MRARPHLFPMYSRSSEPVQFERDCDAIMVPQGDAVTLPAGSYGYITQALGGSYTVFVEGNLFRIAGKDGDAIGKEPPPGLELPEDANDEAVEAMVGGDAIALGRLLDASHRSLRDDYEVSTPEVDRLVELARDEEGVLGGRITGGGFGGACVFLARSGTAEGAGRRAVDAYVRETGRAGRVLLPHGQARERERSVASPIA